MVCGKYAVMNSYQLTLTGLIKSAQYKLGERIQSGVMVTWLTVKTLNGQHRAKFGIIDQKGVTTIPKGSTLAICTLVEAPRL